MADTTVDPTPMPWLLDDALGDPVSPSLGGALRVTPALAPRVGAGAGVVVVATDALLAHSERLERLREWLAVDAVSLARLHPPGADLLAAAPAAAWQSAHEVAASQSLVRVAAELAEHTDSALRVAIERYSAAEADQRRRVVELGDQLGQLLGPVLRDLIVLGLPVILAAHIVGLPNPQQIAALKQWILDHPEVITSPAFVEAVRAGVMGMDDAVGSAVGLPPAAASQIAAAAGFAGVQAGAAYLLVGAQPLGLFRDGPIAVDRVSTTSLTAGPRGAVERLGRIPEGDQVRVERYDAPGEPSRYMVYVGPTETFSPVAADEPWDLTSNVTGVAGLSSGSIRATEAAMIDAGIERGDQVQFVGFSQGGLVATRLAASGDWSVAGLETYGAPAGNIELRPGIPGMAVRNTDDFVPALAGPQLDHHLLQVERQAFAAGSPIPTQLPVPAHQRSAYVATATEIDSATSDAVRTQITAMDRFTQDYTEREGSSVTVTMYHGERGAAKAQGASAGGPHDGSSGTSGYGASSYGGSIR